MIVDVDVPYIRFVGTYGRLFRIDYQMALLRITTPHKPSLPVSLKVL